jgi:uncharacterized protein (TIGR02246 family)
MGASRKERRDRPKLVNATGQDVNREIVATRRDYIAAMERGDPTALAAHFTDDAILLPQNAEAQHGRTTIEKWFASWLPAVAVRDFEAQTTDLVRVGDTVYEVGSHRMTLVPRNGSPIQEVGKYLMVWKREPDGLWRIFRDMFNTSLAPPRKR